MFSIALSRVSNILSRQLHSCGARYAHPASSFHHQLNSYSSGPRSSSPDYSLHRLGNRRGFSPVRRLCPDDWDHSGTKDEIGIILPNNTKGLSCRLSPPSILGKDSACFALESRHLEDTGLVPVVDGGKFVNGISHPDGHVTLTWTGSPISPSDLKEKITKLFKVYGKKDQGRKDETRAIRW